MRRLLLALALLAAVVAVAGCGGSSGDPGADPAKAVPADAPVYLELVARPGGELRSSAEDALRKVLRTDDPAGRAKQLFDRAAGRKVSWDDVSPWLGERVALFLTSVTGDKAQGAVVAAVSDEDKARDGVAKIAGGKTEKRTYKDVSYRYDAKEDTASGVVDGYAVMGSERGLKAVVDTTKGAPPLADARAYRSARDRLSADESLGLAYVDTAGLTAAIGKSGALGAAAPLLRQLTAQAGTTVAAVLQADGRAIRVTGAGFGAARPATDRSGADVTGALPDDAWLALGLTDVGASLRRSIRQLGDLGAFRGVDPGALLSGFEKSTGIDPERDLLSWMGDAALYVRGTGLTDIGGALTITTTSPARSRAALPRIVRGLRRAGVRVRETTLDGYDDAWELRLSGLPLPIPLYLAGNDKRVTVGINPDALVAIARPTAPLSGSARFRAASDVLGNGLKPSFLLDIRTLTALVGGLGAGESLKPLRPYIDAFGVLAAGGAATATCAAARWRSRSGSERHGHDVEAVDPAEVSGVAGVHGRPVGDRHRGDHRVVGPCRRLAPRPAQGRGDLPERPRRGRVERQRGEVRLRLLQVGLTRGPLALVAGDQRADRQLGERDRRDHRLAREDRRVGDLAQPEQRRGVEDAPRGHSRGRARRRGRRAARRRPAAAAAPALQQPFGRGRAGRKRAEPGDGIPALVIVMLSPPAARSTMAPPRFRRSLMLTSAMSCNVSRMSGPAHRPGRSSAPPRRAAGRPGRAAARRRAESSGRPSPRGRAGRAPARPGRPRPARRAPRRAGRRDGRPVERGDQRGDRLQRAAGAERRERVGARDAEREPARGGPQLGRQHAGVAAADLGEGARRRQAGLDGDAQQVEHVRQLGGHRGRPATGAPAQPQVGGEEAGGGRHRDGREAQAARQRRGGTGGRQERGQRRAGLDGHDVARRDARRKAGGRDAGREAARSRGPTEPAAQRGQQRDQRRPPASRGPRPQLREHERDEGRTRAGQHRRARHAATRAMRRMATHDAACRTSEPSTSVAVSGAASSEARYPGRASSASSAAPRGSSATTRAVKRACAVTERASASTRAPSSSVAASRRSRPERSPPASRCSSIAAAIAS